MQKLMDSLKRAEEDLLKENIAGMPPAGGGSPLGSMPPGGMRRIPGMGSTPFRSKRNPGSNTDQVQGDRFPDKMDVISQDGGVGFPPSWWSEENGPFQDQTHQMAAWFQWLHNHGGLEAFLQGYQGQVTPAMEYFWENLGYLLNNMENYYGWDPDGWSPYITGYFNQLMGAINNYNAHMAGGYIDNPDPSIDGGLTNGLGAPPAGG